ncbi:MAG: lmo0937 family membrane protein [Chloroflexota bacterium]
MLWTIVLVLLVLWLLGVVALPAAGSLIHILLVLALVVLVFQMLSGRRTAL